jgi:hypothetical protein
LRGDPAKRIVLAGMAVLLGANAPQEILKHPVNNPLVKSGADKGFPIN